MELNDYEYHNDKLNVITIMIIIYNVYVYIFVFTSVIMTMVELKKTP